jgi:hypothetical protein
MADSMDKNSAMSFVFGVDTPGDEEQCGAKTRDGSPCENSPAPGKRRCRLHGGAKGSGGQLGNTNALKHGKYCAATLLERRQVNQLIQLLASTNQD